MTGKGAILIIFAWAMEIMGVSGGIINSTYTTFGEELPDSIWGYLPAVPMVALAVAELGRVPLASVIYHKHKLMQAVALLGIVALGYVAAENWTFGFDRIVELRLKPVSVASRELSRAKDDLSALLDQRGQTTISNGQPEMSYAVEIIQRDDSIVGLTAQLGREAEIHQKISRGISEACRLIRGRCIFPRSQAEDARYAGEVGRLSDDLARQREERKQLQVQIDGLVRGDAQDAANLDRKIGTATVAVNEARQTLRGAADGNQVYRLANHLVPRKYIRRHTRTIRYGALGIRNLQRDRRCPRRHRCCPGLLCTQPRGRRSFICGWVDGQGRSRPPSLLCTDA